jgi:hypothetical protein
MKSALVIITIALAMLPCPISAAENVLGDWLFEYENILPPGNPYSATLTIVRRSDGSFGGNVAIQTNEFPLWDTKVEDGLLVFYIKREVSPGKKVVATYKVTVQGTKMTGVVLEPPFHRFDLMGQLQDQPKTGPDAFLGTWKIDVTAAKTVKEYMIFFKNPDGSLGAKCRDIINAKVTRLVYGVSFTGSNLSFTDRMEGMGFTHTCTYQGDVKGDRIEGTVSFKAMRNKFKPMWANRIVPAKADDPNKHDPNS